MALCGCWRQQRTTNVDTRRAVRALQDMSCTLLRKAPKKVPASPAAANVVVHWCLGGAAVPTQLREHA